MKAKAPPKKARPRFVKLDSKGKCLPANAPSWHAVFDTTTKLIWSRTLECGRVTQPEAVEKASEHRLCGKRARLPTRAELLTLVDDTRHSPAIDIAFFPATELNWYWTVTRASPFPGDYAWSVVFSYGGAYYYDQDGSGFVRAVRVGQ